MTFKMLDSEYIVGTTKVVKNTKTGIVSGVVFPGGEPMTVYARSLEEAQAWILRAEKVRESEEARKAFRNDLIAHIRTILPIGG